MSEIQKYEKPRTTGSDRLRKLMNTGKKALPILSGFLAPEFVPVVQAVINRLSAGPAAEHSMEELESRVADHLRQTAAMQGQQQEEIRSRLEEQATIASRLTSEISALRGMVERSNLEQAELAAAMVRLERVVKNAAIAAVAAVVLGAAGLVLALVRR